MQMVMKTVSNSERMVRKVGRLGNFEPEHRNALAERIAENVHGAFTFRLQTVPKTDNIYL
jgi:hypothetical protein